MINREQTIRFWTKLFFYRQSSVRWARIAIASIFVTLGTERALSISNLPEMGRIVPGWAKRLSVKSSTAHIVLPQELLRDPNPAVLKHFASGSLPF